MSVGSSSKQVDYEKLRIEQYKSLRKEAMDLATATRGIETYIIGATAALYAYLTKESLQGKEWVWYLPVLLVSFGAWRSRRLFGRLDDVRHQYHHIEGEAKIPKWTKDKSRWAWVESAKKKFGGPWTAIL